MGNDVRGRPLKVAAYVGCTLEQYSRRNWLVMHGVPNDVNAEHAVLDLCSNKLGIAIGPECIDMI